MPGFGRASRPLAAGPVAAPPPFSLLLPLPMSLLYTPCGTCGGAWSVWRCGGAWSGAGWAAAQGAARPGAHLGGRAPSPSPTFPPTARPTVCPLLNLGGRGGAGAGALDEHEIECVGAAGAERPAPEARARSGRRRACWCGVDARWFCSVVRGPSRARGRRTRCDALEGAPAGQFRNAAACSWGESGVRGWGRARGNFVRRIRDRTGRT